MKIWRKTKKKQQKSDRCYSKVKIRITIAAHSIEQNTFTHISLGISLKYDYKVVKRQMNKKTWEEKERKKKKSCAKSQFFIFFFVLFFLFKMSVQVQFNRIKRHPKANQLPYYDFISFHFIYFFLCNQKLFPFGRERAKDWEKIPQIILCGMERKRKKTQTENATVSTLQTHNKNKKTKKKDFDVQQHRMHNSAMHCTKLNKFMISVQCLIVFSFCVFVETKR